MILVYQMGKVGSVAVRESLARHLPDEDVRHLHVIVEAERWQSIHDDMVARGDVPARGRESVRRVAENARRGMAQFRKHGSRGDTLYIISGVREPVDYAVSAFFQNIEITAPAASVSHEAGSLRDYFSGQLRRFNEQLPARTGAERFIAEMWRYAVGWFEHELEPLLGARLEDFAGAAEGAVRTRCGDVDLLIYRHEDSRRVLQDALRDFTGCAELTLEQDNRTDDKTHGELYRQFRAGLALPVELLEPLYATRQVRTFYRPGEIRDFIRVHSGG